MLSRLHVRRERYPLRQKGSTLPCNLCGGESFAVVRTRDRYLRRLINVMCRHCGLVFLDPMPTDEAVSSYYRHHFWSASQGKAEPTAKQMVRDTRFAQSRMQKLAGVLKPGARILDVGSGSGAFLAQAKAAGFEVVGIEPNIGYARYAERAFGVEVRAALLDEVEFGDRRFDVVTCNHALEHMRDPLGALRRFHGLLDADGHLDLFVPNLSEPNRSPLRNLHSGHLFGFVPETLVMMAARAGFDPIQDYRVGTWLTFRRLPGPDPNWFRFPGHAAASEAMFRERTMLRYLLNANTLGRIPGRLRLWLSDSRAARIRSGNRSSA